MNEATIQNELFAAICHNEHEAVQKLLTEGVAVNSPFANGLTPLMAAARAGAHAVIPVLLSHGADVHATDAQGRTAFHHLCRYGLGSHYHREAHTESARALLAAGADAYLCAADGDSPFRLACSRGLRCVLKLIHAQSPIPTDMSFNDGETPLHLACHHFNATYFLLCIGCNPYQPMAPTQSTEESVDMWSWQNRINRQREQYGKEQWDAWYVSPPRPPEAQEVDTTWVDTIDLHATDKRGYTALHHAATQGLYDVAAKLIERGAEVDAPARSGATPLMLAARAGRWKVGHLLLAYGADAYRQDCHKLNACEYARRAGNYRMSALF